MNNQRPITTMKLFNAQSIAAGENASSVAVDLREIAQNGYFSLGYTITGTGTIKLEYLLGETKDGTFTEPASASDIGATLAAGSGWLSFSPMLAPFLKIKATEDGGAAAAVLTASLNVQ